MKHIFLFLVFLLTNLILLAQNTNNEATEIKQQMSAIRKSTNWSDAAAAKEANAKIEALSAKLTQALRKSSQAQLQNQQGSNETPSDANVKNEMQQKMDNYNSKLMNQMMKIVREGDEGHMDLAEPLREEIVEEYQNEDTKKPIPLVTDELEILVIDMSVKGIQALIDNMALFKSVKTLVITSSESPLPVDVKSILKNALSYPLNELYIVNFGPYLKTIPTEISQFAELGTLGIFNNSLSTIPTEVKNLHALTKLYLDNNPLTTTFPVINALTNIEELGLVNTKVSESEIKQIKNMYNSCKVLAK